MKNLPVIHIGGMRTGSTFMQQYFADHEEVDLRLKSRLFSYEPYWGDRTDFSLDQKKAAVYVDSDENYALGRFKSKLISYIDSDYSFKKEYYHIDHDIPKMANRIKAYYPEARILLIIRQQGSWIRSVYSHDVEHFGVDLDFETFTESQVGLSYVEAGNYLHLYELYWGLFGVENVKVLLFEDLKADSDFFFDELSDFIGLRFLKPDRPASNASMSDKEISYLRLINKLSQSNPVKKERRLYYLLRGAFLRNRRLLGFLPDNQLIKQSSINEFEQSYYASNLKLAYKLKKVDRMRKYGYFD